MKKMVRSVRAGIAWDYLHPQVLEFWDVVRFRDLGPLLRCQTRKTPRRDSKNADAFVRRTPFRRRFFFSCFRSDETEAFSSLMSDDIRDSPVLSLKRFDILRYALTCTSSSESGHLPRCDPGGIYLCISEDELEKCSLRIVVSNPYEAGSGVS